MSIEFYGRTSPTHTTDTNDKSLIKKIERHYVSYNYGDKATADFEHSLKERKSQSFDMSVAESCDSSSSRFSKPPSNLFELTRTFPERRSKIHGRKLEGLMEELKSRGLEWDPKGFEAKMSGEAAFYAGLGLLGKLGFVAAKILPSLSGENGEFDFDVMDDLPDCFDSLFDWNKLFGGH